MAALSRRLRPCVARWLWLPFFVLAFTAALYTRLRPLRGPSSRKVIPCSARGVYGVRWRLSRFFRLLLECLCGASLQFLRASSEQLLTSPESNYFAAKEQHKTHEHVTLPSRKSGSCAARTSHRLQTEEIK